MIKEYFNPDHLVTIAERPFTAAVKKSFSLGAESGVKWTICIDADVLLEKEGILSLLEFAEDTDEHIFCIQGQVYDKLIPIKRAAGNHIYRNLLMLKALEVIPADVTLKRPESETTRAMKALGYFTYQTNILVGIHDFEQFHSDIFRKCFIHVNKHEKALVPLIIDHWYANRAEDNDFESAWLGGLAGKSHEGDLIIDQNFQREAAQKLLSFKAIQEKKAIDISVFESRQVEMIIRSFEIDSAMLKLKNPRVEQIYLKDFPSIKKVNSRERIVNFMKRVFGKILIVLGRKMINLQLRLTNPNE
ncbi:hypothetical protein GCM10009117_03930 [Gangjinia marincola]|uniref:Glycosyltransferase 2-like domain-containing protein n=1 Tax=Gangjinia marincola TaxID=578463 RepID=A0ABN1MDS0_9FLAO